MKNIKVKHSSTDLILDRYDKINILSSQANVLINYLPNYVVHEPFPNGGRAPQGSYTKIYSPIFDDSIDMETELEIIYKGISEFINHLNANGNTISRISCWVNQSDDLDGVPHPDNNVQGNPGTTPKYNANKDYQLSNWLFCDIFAEKDFHKQTVYGNIFNREINDKDPIIKKKYWTLRLDSDWGSL